MHSFLKEHLTLFYVLMSMLWVVISSFFRAFWSIISFQASFYNFFTFPWWLSFISNPVIYVYKFMKNTPCHFTFPFSFSHDICFWSLVRGHTSFFFLFLYTPRQSLEILIDSSLFYSLCNLSSINSYIYLEVGSLTTILWLLIYLHW